MKKYSIVHPWIMSFFSPSLYRDVARNWHGIAFTYLSFLMLIFCLPFGYTLYVAQKNFAANELPAWLAQMPTMTIHQGQLSIDKTVPYFIKDPDSGEVVAIIDTSGQYTSLSNTKAGILITKDKVSFKKNENETNTYDISTMKDGTFGKDDAKSLFDKIRIWIPVIAYVGMVIIGCIYRVLQSLIYAALGMISTKLFRVSLSYQELIRISMIALTPSFILSSVLDIFNITFQHELLVLIGWFVLSMFYVSFGVYANKKSDDVA